jgi:opacity protein-like surface antigen
MRKLLLSTVIVAASVTGHATSSAFNGFYVGAGAGVVKSKTKTDVTQVAETWLNSKKISINKSKTSNGLLLGLYAGYGVNLNDFYFGGEISITGDFVNRHINLLDASDPVFSERNYEANTKYKRSLAFGVAPRLGYVFSNNLIYIKPGIEINRDQVTVTYNGTNSVSPNKNVSLSASTRKTSILFTPSFGYERSWGRIILRGEYSYNPGKKITVPTDNVRISGYANASYSDHRLMLGVAYKF